MTASSNDYGYERVFERQVLAVGRSAKRFSVFHVRQFDESHVVCAVVERTLFPRLA